MKLVMMRLIAVILLVVPGLAATYGFLAMKDSIFYAVQPSHAFPWFKFLLGFILFALGVTFLGGWIFFRDRKRNYVAPRFKKKRKRPRRPAGTAE